MLRKLDVIALTAMNVDYVVDGPTGLNYFDRVRKGTEREETDHRHLMKAVENLKRRGCDIRLGGSGLNMARALAEIAPDLRVGIAAPAAQLPPEVDLAELTSRGIDVDGLWKYGGPPGTCVSVLEGGDRTLVTFENAAATAALAKGHARDALVAQLARARHVHVTSLFGRDAPQRISAVLAQLRQTAPRVVISVDLGHVWAGNRRAMAKVLTEADLIFLNRDELNLLTTPGGDDSDPVAERTRRVSEVLTMTARPKATVYVKTLEDRSEPGHYRYARAGGTVFVRNGDGLASESETFLMEALPTGAIADSTGAGDVFAAGIVAERYSPRVRTTAGLRVALEAVRHKIQRTGIASYSELGDVRRGVDPSPNRQKVFISHASADEALVRALQRALLEGSRELPGDHFYCTSFPGQRGGIGSPLYHEISTHLRAAPLVLFVITKAYFESRNCTYEMGVAAALDLPSAVLLAPGFVFEDPRIPPILQRRGAYLDDEQAIRELREELARRYGYDQALGWQGWPGVFAELRQEAGRRRRRRPAG